MRFALENASIVIVAKAHNPSILQPFFLHEKNIIPKEWDWQGAMATLTPPLSQIIFREEFAITADFQKLVFQENDADRVPGESSLGTIVDNYTKQLPHTPYTGVGINFTGRIERQSREDAETFLLRRFVTSGKWIRYDEAATAVALKFVYSLKDSKCSLSLDPGEVIKVDKPQEVIPVIFVHVNYHRDADQSNKDWLSSAIKKWPDDYNHYLKMVDELLLSNKR